MPTPLIKPDNVRPAMTDRVNVSDLRGTYFWCVKFQCTPAQLEVAVPPKAPPAPSHAPANPQPSLA